MTLSMGMVRINAAVSGVVVFVVPARIRETGRVIAREGDGWVEDLKALPHVDAARFGTQQVGNMVRDFYNRTHQLSLDYFQEVGECYGDIGLGLIHVADLYDATESENVTTAALVAQEIANIGLVS